MRKTELPQQSSADENTLTMHYTSCTSRQIKKPGRATMIFFSISVAFCSTSTNLAQPLPSNESNPQQQTVAGNDESAVHLSEVLRYWLVDADSQKTLERANQLLPILRRQFDKTGEKSELELLLPIMADSHIENNNLDKAKDLLKQLLAVERHSYDKNDWRIVETLSWLDCLEQRTKFTQKKQSQLFQADQLETSAWRAVLTGRIDESITQARKVLQIRTANLGGEHYQTYLIYDLLGYAHAVSGKVIEALDHYRNAIKIQKELLETREIKYAEAVTGVYKELQEELSHIDPANLSSALASSAEFVAISEQIYGKQHDSYLGALKQMEDLLQMNVEHYLPLGEFKIAARLCGQIVTIRARRLGHQHWGVVDARNALNYIKLSSSFKEEEHRKLNTALSLVNDASKLRQSGKIQEAEGILLEAMQLQVDVLGKEHLETAYTIEQLAKLYDSNDENAEALSLYLNALWIYKKACGDVHPNVVTTLFRIGLICMEMGDYVRAEGPLSEAVSASEQCHGENNPNMAIILTSLTKLYLQIGDLDRAEVLGTKAVHILKEPRTDPEYARYYSVALHNLAAVYIAKGRFSDAASYASQSLELARQELGSNHRNVAKYLQVQGRLYVEAEEYDEAESSYNEAKRILEEGAENRNPDYGALLNNIGALYLAKKEYQHAETVLYEALALLENDREKSGEFYTATCSNLAILYRAIGNQERAAEFLQRACELSYQRLAQLSGMHSERQQLAAAREFEHHLHNYLSLANLDDRHNKLAYQAMLRWKGAIFMRQLRRHLALQDSEMEGVANGLRETNTRLSKLFFSLAQGDRENKSTEDQIARLSATKRFLEGTLARKVQAMKHSISIEAIQANLPNNSLLVDFLEYRYRFTEAEAASDAEWERRLVAFVVSQDAPIRRVDLGKSEDIENAIDQWRRSIVHHGKTRGGDRRLRPSLPKQHSLESPGTRVRQLVWQPLEAIVADADMILISPDSVLARCPFIGLPGKLPNAYLIEDWPIVMVPVPQMLSTSIVSPSNDDQHIAGDNAPNGFVLVGDVAFDAELNEPLRLAGNNQAAARRSGQLDFPPLPGTKKEVEGLKALFVKTHQNADIEVLRNTRARESAIRAHAPRGRYLHFATHGFFAKDITNSTVGDSHRHHQRSARFSQDVVGYHPGLLSGLALAGAGHQADLSDTGAQQGDDGILTALEVADLDMRHTELVVLSACDTSLGKVAGGEGVLGLQRAFQVAGAKTVVASLWKIDDAGTQALMVEFYKNLWEKKQSKLEALRNAQLAMLRGDLYQPLGDGLSEIKTSHRRLPPYFWAAFQLSGDWR